MAERQKICLKGDIVLVKADRSIELGGFRDGVEFYADELDEIEKILVRDRRFMTVENKTSYMRCREEETSYFYLGGYRNRFQREFLKKVFQDILNNRLLEKLQETACRGSVISTDCERS